MAAYNISLIGAGNVAASLAAGLSAAGHRILTVASRTGLSARELAGRVNASFRSDLTIPGECDLVIISVTDSAVAEVAASLHLPSRTVVVHTAGSVTLAALGRSSRAGVLYPLQTFSREYPPDLGKVPFFIEATDSKTLQMLRETAESIGAGAWECGSEQRRKLHVAAVFTNNFSNFMMTLGETLARETGYDPEVMRPLMEETIRKALRTGPETAQTGPARRDDRGTIKSHIELLSFSPQYQELYRMISEMITGHYKKQGR